MAWTAPRTWVTGETVTAALLNTHIRDNLLVLGAFEGWQLTNVADIDFGANEQDITWTTEDIDTDGFHASSDANITIPSNFDGTYLITFQLHMARQGSSGINAADIFVIKNSTDTFAARGAADTGIQGFDAITGSFYIDLVATDTVKLEIQDGTDWLLQFDTFNLTVTGSWFSGQRVAIA